MVNWFPSYWACTYNQFQRFHSPVNSNDSLSKECAWILLLPCPSIRSYVCPFVCFTSDIVTILTQTCSLVSRLGVYCLSQMYRCIWKCCSVRFLTFAGERTAEVWLFVLPFYFIFEYSASFKHVNIWKDELWSFTGGNYQ